MVETDATRVRAACGPARYELGGDDHDHLVCRECGGDRRHPPQPGSRPCLDPGDAAFAVNFTEVTY